MQKIIDIKNGVTGNPAWAMAQPVNLTLCDGEHIAIVGDNGAGKTMLADIITGAHPLRLQAATYNFAPSQRPLLSDNIKYIAFTDSYGTATDGTYYLQQRWNHHDIDDDTPTVGDRLDRDYRLSGPDTPERQALRSHLYDLFDIEPLLSQYVISLSSGELRKMQLVRALFANPRVLVMDNPFIGLDPNTRQQLADLLASLAAQRKLQLVVVLARESDIPPFVTHVVRVENKIVGEKVAVKQSEPHNVENNVASTKPSVLPNIDNNADSEPNSLASSSFGDELVRMNNVTIRYGERTIIKNLNWTVRRGERWLLTGQNGSGKSTLLSILCADNPQGYAADISLFGCRRGAGESIWDIKRRIGYVSPEMHRAYHYDLPCLRIVASGLKDSVGLYAQTHESEYEVCREWLRRFGVDHLANRTFLSLSSGEQRMVLLARAFVKEPELLILDEPFHGLDDKRQQWVTDVIEDYFRQTDKTLIFVSHYMSEVPPCVTHRLALVKQK